MTGDLRTVDDGVLRAGFGRMIEALNRVGERSTAAQREMEALRAEVRLLREDRADPDLSLEREAGRRILLDAMRQAREIESAAEDKAARTRREAEDAAAALFERAPQAVSERGAAEAPQEDITALLAEAQASRAKAAEELALAEEKRMEAARELSLLTEQRERTKQAEDEYERLIGEVQRERERDKGAADGVMTRNAEARDKALRAAEARARNEEERIIREAREEAEEILREARAEAGRVRPSRPESAEEAETLEAFRSFLLDRLMEFAESNGMGDDDPRLPMLAEAVDRAAPFLDPLAAPPPAKRARSERSRILEEIANITAGEL